MALHILKMAAGVRSLKQIKEWQERNAIKHNGHKAVIHRTRSMPRRRDEIAGKGSLYWVFARHIQARNPLIDIVELEGRKRCGFVLGLPLVPVQPARHRPIQGWRYLEGKDAPPDIRGKMAGGEPLPPELIRELGDLGLL